MATFRLIVIVALAELAALGLALLAAMLTPLPAQAQGMCMPWETMRTLLADRFGEMPVGGGTLNGETALRVFVSPGGATFTIVAVHVSGRACAMAAGSDWDAGTPPPPPGREG